MNILGKYIIIPQHYGKWNPGECLPQSQGIRQEELRLRAEDSGERDGWGICNFLLALSFK